MAGLAYYYNLLTSAVEWMPAVLKFLVDWGGLTLTAIFLLLLPLNWALNRKRT